MTEGNNDEFALLRSAQEEDLLSNGSKAQVDLKEQIQPKNRVWNEQEHILYILFLELNRDKIKSKLIRRSNSFYKEMAEFIGTKTGVQCRSHHQKYETRYKYPHRIIREEKQKLNLPLYTSTREHLLLKSTGSSSNNLTDTGNQVTHKQVQHGRKETQQTSVCCQTQIQGVSTILLQPQHLAQYQYWNYPFGNYQTMMPSDCLPQWNPFGHMAAFYKNSFY